MTPPHSTAWSTASSCSGQRKGPEGVGKTRVRTEALFILQNDSLQGCLKIRYTSKCLKWYDGQEYFPHIFPEMWKWPKLGCMHTLFGRQNVSLWGEQRGSGGQSLKAWPTARTEVSTLWDSEGLNLNDPNWRDECRCLLDWRKGLRGEKEEDNWRPDARKLPSDIWKPRWGSCGCPFSPSHPSKEGGSRDRQLSREL